MNDLNLKLTIKTHLLFEILKTKVGIGALREYLISKKLIKL